MHSALKYPHIRDVSSDGSDDQVCQELVVQPPAMVGLGLCSQLIIMSLERCFFMEVSVLKTWLVRPANESDCTVNCLWLPREACCDLVHY